MVTHEKLSDFASDKLNVTGTFIHGQWREGEGESIDVIYPGDGTVLGSYASSGTGKVLEAVSAARKAFDEGPWRDYSPLQRSEVLRRLTAEMEKRKDDFAALGALDVGTPITVSRAMQAQMPIDFFNWFADAALRGPMGGYEEGLGVYANAPTPSVSTLYREPVGVVAAISAYNMPLLISAFKGGGALAAGCTVVLMPSEQTLLASILLMHCVQEAGFPEGVVNLVIGRADVGEALTLADGVDLVSFTGSVPVGRAVMQQAATGLKRVVLELGGKSPNILLPSADVDEAVGPSIIRFIRNAGQACGATTRTFVPRDRYDEYAAAAQRFMTESIPVGDPLADETVLGPVISERHRERVLGYVNRAKASGAEVLAHSADGPEAGFYIPAMLIGNVEHEHEICQEELFGPIGVLVPYDDVDHAITMANGTRFGLNANVWGTPDEAISVGMRLKAGTVTINGGGADGPSFPWPGVGESGVGVDRGMEGFHEFFKLRHLQVALR